MQMPAADVEPGLGVSIPTANALMRDFEKLGLLREITGEQRGQAVIPPLCSNSQRAARIFKMGMCTKNQLLSQALSIVYALLGKFALQ